MKPSEVIQQRGKPSEVIQQRGWIQDEGKIPGVGICAGAAVCYAAHPENEGGQAHRASAKCERLWNRLEQVTGSGLTTWNDTPGRTIEQVIALLQEFETEFESDPVEQEEPIAVT